MNKTKKGALGAAGVGVVALAMFGGGTFALWTDDETVKNNTAAAGHLDLNVSGDPFSNVGGEAIAPGENYHQDWFLTSADLDGVPLAALSMTMTDITDFENGCATGSELAAEGGTTCGDEGEFSDQAHMRVRWSQPIADATGKTVADCSWGEDFNNNGSLEGAPTLEDYLNEPLSMGTLGPDEGVCVRVDVALLSSATNATQGDTSVFDLRFNLEQVPGGNGY